MRRSLVVPVVVVLLLGGGSALAYWVLEGRVLGHAMTASGQRIEVGAVHTNDAAMKPGDRQTWLFQVVNNNADGVDLDPVASRVLVAPFRSVAVDPAKPACTEADFAVVGVRMPLHLAGDHYENGEFVLRFENDPARDQTNCQGVEVPLRVTATAL